MRSSGRSLSGAPRPGEGLFTALFAIGAGYQLSEVAVILGVSQEAIRLWVRDFIAKGMKSLRFGKSPGRPPKLTKSQKKELATVIEKGPEAAGFCGSCWRSPMIQSLIERRFGALYSVHYVVQLLANMGFSYQKAAFESCHLDEEARRKWLDETWPEIQNLANQKNSHLLFGDEASFPQWGSLSYAQASPGLL
jgi:transposase